MAEEDLILQPLDAQLLAEKTLLEGNGSMQRLDRRWQLSEDFVESSTCVYSEFDDKVDIPERLSSRATFEFLGFTPEVAEQLWAKKLAIDKVPLFIGNFGNPTLDLALGRARLCDVDINADAQSWRAAFKAIGIKKWLRDAILDQRYEEVRATESAAHWLKDTIRHRWEHLLEMKRTSIIRNEKAKFYQNGAVDYEQPLYLQTRRPRYIPTVVSVSPNGVVSSATTDTHASAFKEVPPGHIALWKAAANTRVELGSTGKINACKLTSNAPTDFTSQAQGLYLAQEKSVALLYASYLLRRADVNAILVRIVVQEEFIESLKPYQLNGDEWRTSVFVNRNRISTSTRAIAQQTNRWERNKLLVGHISKGYPQRSNDIATWDARLEVPCTGNKTVYGTQYVFIGDEAQFRLTEEGEVTCYELQWDRTL